MTEPNNSIIEEKDIPQTEEVAPTPERQDIADTEESVDMDEVTNRQLNEDDDQA
jgi:hypothetical protein